MAAIFEVISLSQLLFISFTLGIFVVLLILRQVLVTDETAPEVRAEYFKNEIAKDQTKRIVIKNKEGWNADSFSNRLSRSLNLNLLLKQAGMHGNIKMIIALFFLTSLVVGVAIWFLTEDVKLSVLGFIGYFIFNYLHLFYKKSKRLKKFEEIFPQTLEILARSLKAGHPFNAGIQVVYTEMPDPIKEEFEQLYQEIKLGISLEDALKNMSLRVPLTDFRYFIIAILIHQNVGGDLAEILENLASVIRERFKIRRQVKALTAAGRLTGWILALLPVFCFFAITIANPKYISVLTQESFGTRLLIMAIVMTLLGMVIIRKIVNIRI